MLIEHFYTFFWKYVFWLIFLKYGFLGFVKYWVAFMSLCIWQVNIWFIIVLSNISYILYLVILYCYYFFCYEKAFDKSLLFVLTCYFHILLSIVYFHSLMKSSENLYLFFRTQMRRAVFLYITKTQSFLKGISSFKGCRATDV